LSQAGIKPSIVAKVNLAYAAGLQDTLNALASDGYRYGALTPCFKSDGGISLFTRQKGVYVDWAMLRMDPRMAVVFISSGRYLYAVPA